ncbi:glycosyltransferase family 2 protein [Streptomyces sp. cmx-18-6]|uniref:glycosyltransferase family 2 protein n=1 Tax=Streptomyces sp. cmx-18-6 TaxID=2790930 RepID=UPI00397E9E18
MTEGVVLIPRDAFDAVGGWEGQLFLRHEGFDLAWRLYEAGWSGWYAASIRMHHPLSEPARHTLYHRLAARIRIWIAHRHLPAPLLPVYLSAWTTITLARAVRGGGPGQTLRGMREGWTSRGTQGRRPMSRRTVYRLTAAGRPPIIRPLRPVRRFEESFRHEPTVAVADGVFAHPAGPPTPQAPRRPPGRNRTHRNHLVVNTTAHPNRRTSPETT